MGCELAAPGGQWAGRSIPRDIPWAGPFDSLEPSLGRVRERTAGPARLSHGMTSATPTDTAGNSVGEIESPGRNVRTSA